MGLIHSPSIITDGLVLALDAQNSRSYPGSGTAWTDITYRGNNGTLTNGPTFEPGGPFAGSAGGSVYFDGSGDTLTLPVNSSLSIGTNQYTIEMYVYIVSATNYGTFFYNNTNGGLIFALTSSTSTIHIGTQNQAVEISGTGPSFNQWAHIAATRDASNVTRIFVNGVIVASGTLTTNYASGGTPTINRSNTSLNAYISNFRIITGTALYTSNFTPPTKPLLPVTNTSLLTCQGGAIVDSSSNKFTITRNGDARAVKTAAIKFDGSNDGVSLPGTDLSLNQMTISSWNYSSGYSQQGFMFEKTTNGSVNTQYSLFFDTGPTLIYRTQGLSTTDLSINATTAGVVNNKWNNIVATFDGTNKRIYVNGVLATTSANLTGTVTANSTGAAYIGIYGSFGGYAFNGSIANTTIYNRALTASEISYNFNAMRNRFGI